MLAKFERGRSSLPKQREFLTVGLMVLRQQSSPESKQVDSPHRETGEV